MKNKEKTNTQLSKERDVIEREMLRIEEMWYIEGTANPHDAAEYETLARLQEELTAKIRRPGRHDGP